jgi:hypothetical protein
MPRDERHGGGTVETILAYLDAHPEAADTVDGIRQWWLAAGAERSPADVQAALDLLVERGLVARVEQPGVPPLYRRAPGTHRRPRTT